MAPFSRGPVLKGRVVKKRPGNVKSRQHPQGPKKNGFATSRIAEIESREAHESSAPQVDSELIDEDVNLSSDEESVPEDARGSNPYSSLLQSLTDGSTTNSLQKRGLERSKPQHARLKETEEAPEISDNEVEVEVEEDELVDPDSEDEVASTQSEERDTGSNDYFDTHFCRSAESGLPEYIHKAQSALLTSSTTRMGGQWKAASVGLSGHRYDGKLDLSKETSLAELGVKQRLQARGAPVISGIGGIESYVANLLFGYVDILFNARNRSNTNTLLRMSCLHALNHVLKTRDRVLKNNEKATQEDVDDSQFCDQGFTRPKVLFLLPTRQACYRAVSEIVSLYEPEQQENRKRFQQGFRKTDEVISEEKPQDFHDLFAGNDDDMFRIGLKFTRKTVKFFAPFYTSDVIFASPLGLRMAIGDEDSKKRDYDYLSSIEVVVVEHADALLMQNWEHVEYIFDHLNLQPREAHGCDFGRVRPWYLDGHAKYVRQTVVLSSFNTPEINNLFNFKMTNFAGKVKIGEAVCKGLISAPNALFKQVFYRFDAAEPSSEPDARFKYFTSKLVPQIVKRIKDNPGQKHGILVFINSYMDFVRVRNYFANSIATRDVSFASLSEYAAAPEIARARSHFLNGKHSVLLYTSRIHHFRRYQLKGTKQSIFYSLPDNPIFWKEVAADFPARSVAAGKADGAEVTIQALFSRWDALRLERIVGTERLKQMLTDETGDIFEFIP